MVEFVRVYDNGLYVVAQFRWVLQPFDGTRRALRGFVMNERDLLGRIENLKRNGLPVHEEIEALSAIRGFRNAEEVNTTS